MGADGDDLKEDAEELVRVGRSDEKVVVGVKAAVEVEPTEYVLSLGTSSTLFLAGFSELQRTS